MKYFCVSDVHSFYDELMTALDKAGFDIDNEEHIFVSAGDLLDRGDDALKCLNFVNNLPDNRKILIRGNHEDLIEEIFRKKCFESHDFHNKTVNTCEQLSGIYFEEPLYLLYERGIYWDMMQAMIEDTKNNKELQKYLDSVVDYAEVGDYIIVHGWIPDGEDWRDSSKYYWENARWENGLKHWDTFGGEEGKTIVCGHYTTSWAHKILRGIDNCFDIFEDDGIVALDGSVAYTHNVNCFVFEV